MLHEVRMILGFKRKFMVILRLYGHIYSPFLLFLCLFQSHEQGAGMEIGMGTGTGENEFFCCRYSNSLEMPVDLMSQLIIVSTITSLFFMCRGCTMRDNIRRGVLASHRPFLI